MPDDRFEISIDGIKVEGVGQPITPRGEPISARGKAIPLRGESITITRTFPLPFADYEHWLRRSLGEFDA